MSETAILYWLNSAHARQLPLHRLLSSKVPLLQMPDERVHLPEAVRRDSHLLPLTITTAVSVSPRLRRGYVYHSALYAVCT